MQMLGSPLVPLCNDIFSILRENYSDLFQKYLILQDDMKKLREIKKKQAYWLIKKKKPCKLRETNSLWISGLWNIYSVAKKTLKSEMNFGK